MELTMAASISNLIPTIGIELFDDLAHLHDLTTVETSHYSIRYLSLIYRYWRCAVNYFSLSTPELPGTIGVTNT